MYRMLFEKTGNAVWISHLDLMRLFQRGFKRAGLPLTHTQGFNPRPSVSIALPLSVGVESVCELLDFDLDGDPVSLEQIKRRLNEVLVDGVYVRSVYAGGRKLRDLSFLSCEIILEYDHGVPIGAAEDIRELFKRSSVIVQKKTKSGFVDQDIIPMIRKLDIQQCDGEIVLKTLICCQNPSLSPGQLVNAIGSNLPQYKPDFSRITRLELFDREENIFR